MAVEQTSAMDSFKLFNFILHTAVSSSGNILKTRLLACEHAHQFMLVELYIYF